MSWGYYTLVASPAARRNAGREPLGDGQRGAQQAASTFQSAPVGKKLGAPPAKLHRIG
jgi:hypothetical protein